MHTKLLDHKRVDNLHKNGTASFPLNQPVSRTSPLLSQRRSYGGEATSFDTIRDEINTDNLMAKLVSSLNINQIIKMLHQETQQQVDTTNFAIVIYDEQTNVLAVPLMIEHNRRRKPFIVRRSHIRGLVSETLAQSSPFLISDLHLLDPPTGVDPIRPARSIRSWLSVPFHNPLRSEEKACGAIIVWSDRPGAFTRQQLYRLNRLGLPAALAIRNVQLHQTEQRQALELAVINDIVQALASTLQLDKVLNRIMELVEGMLKAKDGALLLTNPITKELFFQIALGEAKIKPFRLSHHDSVAGHVAFTSKKPELVTRIGPEKRRYLKLADHLRIEPRNCLYVPLILKERVIGVLAVMNKSEGSFTQSDVRLLSSIAIYAAIAIENARLHETALAERDRALVIEEEARNELARDLHDGPTQLVSGLKMRLAHCQKALEKDPSLLEAEFSEMEKMFDNTVHQMRTMLMELLPPDLTQYGQGLGAAIPRLLERRQQEVPNTKLSHTITSYHPNHYISRQDHQVEKAIFKIVQESLNNALKHARAGQIIVHVEETPDTIGAMIIDDGQGFDLAKTMENYGQRGSLGMLNIQERAEAIGGTLEINSIPGRGTRIALVVPKSKTERLRRRGTTGALKLPLVQEI